MSRPTSPSPSRRTLVKGAAWAVPAVAVASAAPAMAQSQLVLIEHLGGACKLPGNSCQPLTKGYLIPVRICTNVRGTVTIDFGTVTGTLCGDTKTWDAQPDPLTIEGSSEGDTVCRTDVRFGVVDQDDSANCAISGSAPFTWTSTNGLSGSGSLTFAADSTPPCVNCAPPVAGTEPAPATVEEPAGDDEGSEEQSTPASKAETSPPDAEVPAPEVKETPDVQAPDTSEQTATPSNS